MTHRRADALRPLVGLRSSGEEFPLEATISQVEVGGQHLATVILRDISERLRAEAALRDSNERFRQLAESISEVFFLTSVDGSRMEYISPAYETIWGSSCAELYDDSLHWVESIHEADRERVMAALARQPQAYFDDEYRIVRPDGSIRWIRARTFPVRNEAGAVIRIAGVAEDITERRDLERQLLYAQRLESIGQLAGGVAHDFNNWLTVISANCEIALTSLEPDSDAADCINEVRRAGDRAAALTRQLLTFSRQQVVEARVLDLNAVVTDLEKMLRRLIGEHIELQTDLRAIGHVVMDPGHVSQILMNLAVNARDALPAGGRLLIETRDVERAGGACDGSPVRRWVSLRIADNGTGMSAAVRSQIFEPFFTTKGIGHGTGLGLAVVHGIVKQAGGCIDVETSPGKGTTFTILLPAAEQAVAPPAGSRGTPQRGTETILVVEDEDLVRRVAVRALRSAGYAVLDAPDGAQALRVAAAHPGPVHLAITDVVMPGMGGREVAEALRRDHPATAIVFASGYLDDAIVHQGIQQSEVAFLPKPYDVGSLLAKVRETLDQS
jgi:PAS domain S-box-containing protein